MRKLFLLAIIGAGLISCKQAAQPKEVAEAFIKALHNGDVAAAQVLATQNSQNVFNGLAGGKVNTTAEESFELKSLTQNITGNTAEVKNNVLTIVLMEEDGWKVIASKELAVEILQRENKLQILQASWNALVKEYEARLKIATNYIEFKKQNGRLSANTIALKKALGNAVAPAAWTKESKEQYLALQNGLAKTIDNAIEPSFTAHSDMGMNYILQLSQANDRIKKAKREFEISIK